MGLLKTPHPSFLTAILIAAAMGIASAASANDARYEPKFHMYPRVYAKVWDNMPVEASLIQAKCKSGDDDLGYQFLKPGTAFEWSFFPNVWGGTLFTCVVSVGYGRVGFNAYNFERDYKPGRCTTECIWRARPDGMHGYNELTKSEDIFYPWDI